MANFNFNKVILGGRLCADPELKTTASGIAVTSFSVAVNRRHGSKDGDQVADFISCTAWRQQAEFISKYFRKGSSICVVGSLQTRNWTDGSGTKRYITEVIVDEVFFVDSKGENSNVNSGTSYTPATYIPDSYKAPVPSEAPAFEIITDDDLPF